MHRSLIVFVLVLAPSWSLYAKPPTPAPVKSNLPDTINVTVAGNIVMAGQPSKEAFKELAKRNIKTVITLRHPEEESFDQVTLCDELGMKCIRLKIRSPDDIDAKLIKRACELLGSASDDSGVLLHCASANRVGAIWLAYRVRNESIPIEQARKEAATVGLKTKVLEKQTIKVLEDESL